MNPNPATTWKFLAPNPKSAYKQLFFKGRRIRARTLYGMYMSAEEPRTPAEIAADYDLPLQQSRKPSRTARTTRRRSGKISSARSG